MEVKGVNMLLFTQFLTDFVSLSCVYEAELGNGLPVEMVVFEMGYHCHCDHGDKKEPVNFSLSFGIRS